MVRSCRHLRRVGLPRTGGSEAIEERGVVGTQCNAALEKTRSKAAGGAKVRCRRARIGRRLPREALRWTSWVGRLDSSAAGAGRTWSSRVSSPCRNRGDGAAAGIGVRCPAFGERPALRRESGITAGSQQSTSTADFLQKEAGGARSLRGSRDRRGELLDALVSRLPRPTSTSVPAGAGPLPEEMGTGDPQ